MPRAEWQRRSRPPMPRPPRTLYFAATIGSVRARRSKSGLSVAAARLKTLGAIGTNAAAKPLTIEAKKTPAIPTSILESGRSVACAGCEPSPPSKLSTMLAIVARGAQTTRRVAQPGASRKAIALLPRSPASNSPAVPLSIPCRTSFIATDPRLRRSSAQACPTFSRPTRSIGNRSTALPRPAPPMSCCRLCDLDCASVAVIAYQAASLRGSGSVPAPGNVSRSTSSIVGRS